MNNNDLKKPAVSVVMAVYNGGKFLDESIRSVLSQTFTNFEFIIVNDGSTDETSEILKTFSLHDSRIKILTNEKNIKIAASLNKGIQSASTPLIARMDADDICLPHRLQVQMAFMSEHPEVTVCGSGFTIYENAKICQFPLQNNAIRRAMLFYNPLAHPTIIMRRQAFEEVGGYDTSKPPAEDYALWVQLAKRTEIVFANVPDILLRYRENFENNREKYHEKQTLLANNISCDYLKILFPYKITEQHIKYHLKTAHQNFLSHPLDMQNSILWYEYFMKLVDTELCIDKEQWLCEIQRQWISFCNRILGKDTYKKSLFYYIYFLCFPNTLSCVNSFKYKQFAFKVLCTKIKTYFLRKYT